MFGASVAVLLMTFGCPFGPPPDDEPEQEFREEVPFHKMPDLAVAGLTIEPARVNPGDTVSVEASIMNQGREISSAAELVLWVDGVEIGREAARDGPSAIAPFIQAMKGQKTVAQRVVQYGQAVRGRLRND